jgi:hypothetical protein
MKLGGMVEPLYSADLVMESHELLVHDEMRRISLPSSVLNWEKLSVTVRAPLGIIIQ